MKVKEIKDAINNLNDDDELLIRVPIIYGDESFPTMQAWTTLISVGDFDINSFEFSALACVSPIYLEKDMALS